jgi:hypothetical protein
LPATTRNGGGSGTSRPHRPSRSANSRPPPRSWPEYRLLGCRRCRRQAREIRELQYQFQAPFVLDSTEAQDAFGIEPVPTADALEETIKSAR